MRKKYALVGTGGRAEFFYGAIASQFSQYGELVAFCDQNMTRQHYANTLLQEKYHHPAIATYAAKDFDKMVDEQNPDIVIVTSVDRTHHTYIIRALELGCDVITEKPITIDVEKAKLIEAAVKQTGKEVRVAFNYRYAPHNTKVKELIQAKTIGEIYSVHFEWALDTTHGADYFRRWHRDKNNSGGLLVHKSTHHFDLVNFWLDTTPEKVYAAGGLRFYGKENAEDRGIEQFYQRAHDNPHAEHDPFALHLAKNPHLKKMYLDAEHEDGYQRDQSVFGDGISIEDTLAVIVHYKNKALLTYSLNAYLPWEGFSVVFNGSKGRIELSVKERSYINSGGEKSDEGEAEALRLTVMPMFAPSYDVPIQLGEGGHGGGDQVLLADLFGAPVIDPFKRAATHTDGIQSIMTGIAGNQSLKSGLPVSITNLYER
ncbi:Oxidoreductase family, C-terminal alpha/beta domain [Amphibacillus marinus]|uniref:Oxidoreductase family, C-terminal alpha/beta domain n=1 Tax=Amphibacillus marinus TaxID=872970 RepID=A0A1H8HC31_9BACI|nr:Gfo/Idh/MocA family oxidoreductase [Amphibacillus marinus]SEN53529.1 Oxidoreductase family, C-terminal alpha/beta domain [Amphibacillus marinus]